jgi:hypothetical protein
MKQALILSMAFVTLLASSTVAGAKQNSDHALLNGPGGDTSVQCGARRGNAPAAFVYYVTMTNLGGVAATVVVTYADSDSVAYQIPAGGSFSFSQAGGGTKNVDDLITVTANPPTSLVGSMSVLVDEGAKPHPTLAPSYCTTTSP